MNGGKKRGNKGKKMLIGIGMLIFPYYISAQWCIDQSRYNEWLCNHVPGAKSACSAPKTIGNFPNEESCNRARKNALPNDFRWQEYTRCIPCGNTSTPDENYYLPSQSQQNEEEKLIETIRAQASKIEEERRQYVLSLKNQKEKDQKEIGETASELLNQMKESTAPPSRMQLQLALEQAFCAAYYSVESAKKVSLKKISGDLDAEAESMRNEASIGFDKEGAPCPPLPFSVPEVNDPSFEKFSEAITQFNLIENESKAVLQKITEQKENLKKITRKQEDLEKKVKNLNSEEIPVQQHETEKDIAKQLEELTREAEEQKKVTELLEKEVNDLATRFDAVVQRLKE